MLRPVLLLALLTAALAALLLGRSALRRWDEQRSRRVYQLPVGARPQAARRTAAAAAGAALTAVLLASLLIGGAGREPSASPAAVSADQDAAPGTPVPKPRPAATASSAADPARFGTVRRTAGGELTAGRVRGAGRVEVWLPARYASGAHARHRSFPAVLVPGPVPDALYQAFSARVDAGLADPFAVVSVPEAAAVCAEGGGRTAERAERAVRSVRRAVTGAHRVLEGAAAWGTLGTGPHGGCALRLAAALPGEVAAGVAVRPESYPELAPAGVRPHLLVVLPHRDLRGREAAEDVRAELSERARLRVVDTVRDFDPEAERRRLYGVAAEYLTERLESPGRR